MTGQAASTTENSALTPRFMQQVALLGVMAFVLGRAVAPALRGARSGLDRVIGYADFAGSVISYFFAFIGLSALMMAMMLTYRERRLGRVYRVSAGICGTVILILIAPAFREPLPEFGSIGAALASAVLALLASREALAVPRTRALGVLLAAAGSAALLHLAAPALAWHAGEHALYREAMFARVLATGSVLFDTLALFTGFAWLRQRPHPLTAWGASAALLIACVVMANAWRGGPRDGSPLWEVVTFRALERLVSAPPAYVWLPYRYALEALAPLLGIVAVAARGQIPSVVGALALALIARPCTDVPLSALALALAALSTPLAARDDRGMWAVLMANSRERSVLGPNSP